MNQLLNDYGIFILVLLFIIFSLYYRNFLHIGIFLILFVAFRNMMDNERALLYAYCISIFYGIVKNFHLLENFTSNNQTGSLIPGNPKPISAIFEKINSNTKNKAQVANKINESLSNSDDKANKINESLSNSDDKANKANSLSEKSNKSKHNSSIKKLNKNDTNKVNQTVKAPEMDEIISEDLINKFIKRLKKEDNLLVTKDKSNIYKLNPTINKLSKNKVEKMRKKMINDDLLVKKPIVVTNDFFILDGHHRWYAKKGIIENNTNGYNSNGLFSEEINVVIIDYNIRKCVQKLQEYKIKYNKDYLDKTIEGINNISAGKQYLDEIKDVIKNLESNYNNFANVELI
jgi:hypothetical protein